MQKFEMRGDVRCCLLMRCTLHAARCTLRSDARWDVGWNREIAGRDSGWTTDKLTEPIQGSSNVATTRTRRNLRVCCSARVAPEDKSWGQS